MSGAGVQPAPFGGRYQILAPLASGGMADLFLARAMGIKGFAKTVVIKRVRRDRDALGDMLLDEARIAAQLVHPNIVQVHDLGAEQGGYFLVMEYVPGPDLRALAREAGRRKTPMPLELALHILLEASAGLHHAHELATEEGRALDIVHRDVSPANILISRDGAVKITDFGIAKFSSEREVETVTGTVKGKFSYMSPEQASGLDIDRRSDVFSLGVVLWEITTGRRLFTGKNDLQVLQKVIHHPITRPSAINPDYMPELEAIVMRALERDVAARYQTVEQLMWDLEDLVDRHNLTGSARRLGRFVTRLFPADQPAADRPTQIAAGTPGVEIAAPRSVEIDELEVDTQVSSAPVGSSPGPSPGSYGFDAVPEYPRAAHLAGYGDTPPPMAMSAVTGTAYVAPPAASSGRTKWIAIGFVLTLAAGATLLTILGGSNPPAPAAAPETTAPETTAPETTAPVAAPASPDAGTTERAGDTRDPSDAPSDDPSDASELELTDSESAGTAPADDPAAAGDDRRKSETRRRRRRPPKRGVDKPKPISRTDGDSALLPSRRSD